MAAAGSPRRADRRCRRRRNDADENLRKSCSALRQALASRDPIGADAQGPDRSKPPAPGPAPPLKLPAIRSGRSSNGLPVWIVEQHEVPLAQVNLVVQLGQRRDDPAGKFGVASLTAAMLDEGAGSRTRCEIADADRLPRRRLSRRQLVRRVGGRLHVPVARLADALPLMADVAAADVSRTPSSSGCAGAADRAAAGARRSATHRRWRSRGSCSARRIATARRRWAPRRR